MLTGVLRGTVCSGGVVSLRAGEQEAVSMTDLVPGGNEREERMQSSIGNNLGSTVENKNGLVKTLIFEKKSSR